MVEFLIEQRGVEERQKARLIRTDKNMNKERARRREIERGGKISGKKDLSKGEQGGRCITVERKTLL